MTAEEEPAAEKADVFLLTVASLATDVESLRTASIWDQVPSESDSARQLDEYVTALETKMDILTSIVANELDSLDKSLLEGKDALDQGHMLVKLWDAYKIRLQQSGSIESAPSILSQTTSVLSQTPSILSTPPTSPPSVKETDSKSIRENHSSGIAQNGSSDPQNNDNASSNNNNIDNNNATESSPSCPRSSPSPTVASGSNKSVPTTPTNRPCGSPTLSAVASATSTPQRTAHSTQQQLASPISVSSSNAADHNAQQPQEVTGINLQRVVEEDLAGLTRAECSRLTVAQINDALTEIEQVYRKKHKKAWRQLEQRESTGQTALYQSPLTAKRSERSKRNAVTASLACKEEEFSETCEFFKKAPRSARAIMNILMTTKRLERVKGTHSVDIQYKIHM